jgi:hypothetical protein
MKIISYPNRHDPEDFERYHLPEILQREFDTILFPICEQDWQFNLHNFKEMREIAERAGLDTWAGPWGLCGLFAGEAISTYKIDDEGCRVFELWKHDIIAAGFRTIFLDEPSGDCDPDGLFHWYSRQRQLTMPEIKLVTTLADDVFCEMTDEHIRNLPVDSVGLSCYHWTRSTERVIRHTLEWTERLITLRPDDHHVWIQGFDLEAGAEWVPVLTKNLARTMGVRDFGHWAFRATRSVATKTPTNWRQVWDDMHA